ncbi:MAG: CARDB domain-containing protein [Chloroflexota bacterium]
MHTKVLFFLVVISLFLASCNLPTNSGTLPDAQPSDPASAPGVDAIGTSVELTAAARALEIAGSAVPPTLVFTDTPVPSPTNTLVPTACVPSVTATANANVRSGPDVAYNVVGYLPLGEKAVVAGRNDASTWWYIEYAPASGGHAWIAGSVTTASCLPAVVQVVAAPPLPPTAVPPTATNVPPTVVVKPDIYVSEYSWSPSPPHMGVTFHIRIGAYNQGDAPSGSFTVQWWLSTSAPAPACTWDIPSLAAHGGRILECDYTPAGWANYPSLVVVDSANTVNESNEGNNTWSADLQILP